VYETGNVMSSWRYFNFAPAGTLFHRVDVSKPDIGTWKLVVSLLL
jgi:hypothetical protein